MSDTSPQVSVCLPTYNHGKYIYQAVASALAQVVNFPMEIVVADDQSTDETPEIINALRQGHPGRIHVRPRQKNLGRPYNFMDAFISCRGKYVAILEGDDYWTASDKLQIQADYLDAHPDCNLCFHRVRVRDETGKRQPYSLPPPQSPGFFSLDNLFAVNFIPTCSLMYRRPPNFEFPPWFKKMKLGDWPLSILIAADGPIGFLDEEMAVYRIHADSCWSTRAKSYRVSAFIEMHKALDRHFAFRYHRRIRELIGQNYYLLAREYLDEGEKAKAARAALRSLPNTPLRRPRVWKSRLGLLAKIPFRR